ncbi:hypothetical protein HK104_004816 [Borealophlyctis nickersoniae]|nr:hypothetical protein HK104_004816 [Borealophlyctis nickersoniae]
MKSHADSADAPRTAVETTVRIFANLRGTQRAAFKLLKRQVSGVIEKVRLGESESGEGEKKDAEAYAVEVTLRDWEDRVDRGCALLEVLCAQNNFKPEIMARVRTSTGSSGLLVDCQNLPRDLRRSNSSGLLGLSYGGEGKMDELSTRLAGTILSSNVVKKPISLLAAVAGERAPTRDIYIHIDTHGAHMLEAIVLASNKAFRQKIAALVGLPEPEGGIPNAVLFAVYTVCWNPLKNSWDGPAVITNPLTLQNDDRIFAFSSADIKSHHDFYTARVLPFLSHTTPPSCSVWDTASTSSSGPDPVNVAALDVSLRTIYRDRLAAARLLVETNPDDERARQLLMDVVRENVE